VAPGLENRYLTAVGIRCADHVTSLYPQKLALTSPTGGGHSVGIVCSRTKATEFDPNNSLHIQYFHSELLVDIFSVVWCVLKHCFASNMQFFRTNNCLINSNIYFIDSVGMCRMQRFLAVLRGFFHSTLSFHLYPPTCLLASLISSFHLFHGLPLCVFFFPDSYTVIYFLRILFSCILCTCLYQCNLFNLIVSVIVTFF
jgi:hypothetical protein